MPTFDEIIDKSGKGSDDSKDFIYLVDINLGGTLGTFSYSNKTRVINDKVFKGKILNVGGIGRSISPEKATYQVSDLKLSFVNTDLEFSKNPWDGKVLDRKCKLWLGFDSLLGTADYKNVFYPVFAGVVKKEERRKKRYDLTITDYTHRMNRQVPPRWVTLTEFPNAGTVAEEDIIGKSLPYVYGDFNGVDAIRPLYIDTVKNRYLIADHAIGTVYKVFSGGAQETNYTAILSGTHTLSDRTMSFIDFDVSQGTKIPTVEVAGKIDTGGTIIENPSLVLRDFLTDTNLGGLSDSDIGTVSFDNVKDQLVAYKYRYVIDDNTKDIWTFIKNISQVSLGNFFFDSSNKATFKVFRPSRSSGTSIIEKEIIKDSFTSSKDLRDLVNEVVVSYNFDWYKNYYKNIHREEGTVSIENFQATKTLKIKARFLYNEAEAEALARRTLTRYQESIHKVSFGVPIKKLPISLGDIVEFSHVEPVSDSGGWDKRFVEIVSQSIDNSKRRLKLRGYDAELVSGNRNYIFLGDETIQGTVWANADSSDRSFGYLCGTNPYVMSDGISSGYRLW
jgi:hypothetical protein